MATERTSIFNLTDAKPKPRGIRMFKQNVLPGGRLVIPVSRLTTASERRRLARMQANKDIFVGPEPPLWYRRLKASTEAELRTKQAQRIPRRRNSVVPPPAKVEVAAEPLFDADLVMMAVRKLNKGDLLQFTTFVRPQMLIAASMTMKEVYSAMEDAFEDGARLVPLNRALGTLGLTDEE